MNEADTRAELIELQLEAAGWKTGDDVRILREFTISDGEIQVNGKRGKKLKADFVLTYKNIKLAVVEAKSDEKDVSEGVAQAKLYAQKLHLNFSFAANGKSIYQINHKNHKEGEVKTFPTPEELWQYNFGEETINKWLEKFNAVPFEDMGGTKQPRYYQELAVTRTIEAIANDKQRILLALATGTGKTFIAFQIAWKLFKSRWTQQKNGKRQPRILFLTDRNILANQAHLDFRTFNKDALVRINPSGIAKHGEVPKNGSVFFTIFQTFMSGKDGKPYFGEYESDFFDLVIIDECHRGGANDESTWRDILNHFKDAVHLGLTATPKHTDNADTYKYFGEPVFTYSLKEGIQDGFLTPFRVKRIQSTIDEYMYTADDDILEGEVEREHIYMEKDFNTRIEIKERERRRVQDMLKAINQNEKSIVFCANQAHAALIRDLINQEVDNKNVDYCVRVTSNDGKIGESLLRQFQDNEKTIPTILTTSRKLTTGVDARNVRNIVLLRPINNMIEFKQIIGRGTRLFEEKNYFTVLDFVNAYHMFNEPDWDGEPIQVIDITDDDNNNNNGDVSDDSNTKNNDNDNNSVDDNDGEVPPKKIRIKLSDNKVREFQSMTSTYFYVGGKPMSAEEFLKYIFNDRNLPELLGSEKELRKLWANPMTREELLNKLEEAGCHKNDLLNFRKLIHSKESDLFDVLAYIAYAKPPVSRAARVETSKDNIYSLLNKNQRDFVSYVLRNYVKAGFEELDIAKLSDTLAAKYGSVDEAKKELGSLEQIQNTFIDFQKHLYKEDVSHV